MKAIRFTEPWKIEYSEVPKPEIMENEVLIRVKVAGICATDLELLSGDMPHIKNGFTKYPLIPGHEWTGQVEKVGSAVMGFDVGDRVTGDVSIGCGCCRFCKIGRYNLCPNRVVIGSYRNKDGAFAEYITVPYRHLYKLPDDLSYEEGALIEPAATATYAVKRAGVGIGDNVLIIGDGPIGQLAMQAAKVAGANQVLIVGSWDEKLEVARQTGADVTMNYKKDDVVAITRETTGGEGADIIIETSGNMSAINQAIQAVRAGGKIALLSWYADTEFPVAVNTAITKDMDIICVLASPNAFEPTLALMASGRINAKPIITHNFSLEKFEDAIEMIQDKKEYRNKVLITI